VMDDHPIIRLGPALPMKAAVHAVKFNGRGKTAGIQAWR
jgi:hypothetical protein